MSEMRSTEARDDLPAEVQDLLLQRKPKAAWHALARLRGISLEAAGDVLDRVSFDEVMEMLDCGNDQATESGRFHDPIRVPGTPERRRYLAAMKHQLSLWLTGVSLHNSENGDCCPDFSCCHPEMRMPMDERAAYYRKHIEDCLG